MTDEDSFDELDGWKSDDDLEPLPLDIPPKRVITYQAVKPEEREFRSLDEGWIRKKPKSKRKKKKRTQRFASQREPSPTKIIRQRTPSPVTRKVASPTLSRQYLHSPSPPLYISPDPSSGSEEETPDLDPSAEPGKGDEIDGSEPAKIKEPRERSPKRRSPRRERSPRRRSPHKERSPVRRQSERDVSPRRGAPDRLQGRRSTRTLFVGNLSYDVNERELLDFFKSLDVNPVNIRLIPDRGIAYVDCETDQDVQNAFKFVARTEFLGRTLRIDYAKARSPDRGSRRSRSPTGPQDHSSWRRTDNSRRRSYERSHSERRDKRRSTGSNRSSPRSRSPDLGRKEGGRRRREEVARDSSTGRRVIKLESKKEVPRTEHKVPSSIFGKAKPIVTKK